VAALFLKLRSAVSVERVWKDVFPRRAALELGGFCRASGDTTGTLTALSNPSSEYRVGAHGLDSPGGLLLHLARGRQPQMKTNFLRVPCRIPLPRQDDGFWPQLSQNPARHLGGRGRKNGVR
jgi:hypothetical protein